MLIAFLFSSVGVKLPTANCPVSQTATRAASQPASQTAPKRPASLPASQTTAKRPAGHTVEKLPAVPPASQDAVEGNFFFLWFLLLAFFYCSFY